MSAQGDSMSERNGEKEDDDLIVATDVSEETSDDEITFEESSPDEIIDDKKVTIEDFINEVLDEFILEICFESHRAARLGYINSVLFSQDCINNRAVNEIPVQRNDENAKGKKKNKDTTSKAILPCPNQDCDKKISVYLHAKHFSTCIEGGRNKKVVNYNENDMFDDVVVPQSSRGKKLSNSQGKPKNKPTSTRTPTYTYQSLQEMSLGDKSAFFSQYCGVKLKSSKYDSLCTKPKYGCNKHTDEERRCMRTILMSIAENHY